ncbi:NLP/P60 hydrolase [Rhodobacteraceae bacterium WD3A24]|nr:NLP/P60 hydrolase [Rhodobacteraceae bacterium WD3A24]
MDPRLTPSNGRVAHASLKGRVSAEHFIDGTCARIGRPLADLRDGPGGRRARQLLMGEGFTVLERRDGHVFGQAARDGHVGWLDEAALVAWAEPTHWVGASATHLYSAPDIKAPERGWLSLGARLRIVGEDGAFARTDGGLFVPRVHLRPLGDWADDPVAVAESLIGTPYLWGGNSRAGLDCSGLVQAALLACGRDCPPDSDLQQELGRPLAKGGGLTRGDLVFWAGHVGWMADSANLLHANAHHMAVAREPLAEAAGRIAAQGGGPITHRRRL